MDCRWPSYRYLAGAGATLLALWAGWRFLSQIEQALFLTFVGAVLAFLVHHPIERLAARVPRPLATLIVALGALAALAALLVWLLPVLAAQAAHLLERVPALLGELASWWAGLQRREHLGALPDAAQIASALQARLESEIVALIQGAVPLAVGVFSIAAAVVYVLAVAFFLAHDPSTYERGLLRLVPRERRGEVHELLVRITWVMKRWVLGALTSMTAVGLLTGAVLWAVGIDAWLLLAFLAFALEVVPYAGPVLAALPGVALGLAQSPGTGLVVIFAYVAIQQLEGNLITPLVMKRAIRIPPALLLPWQIAVALSFGLLGLLVAAPILAIALTAIDHVLDRRERAAGDGAPPPG